MGAITRGCSGGLKSQCRASRRDLHSLNANSSLRAALLILRWLVTALYAPASQNFQMPSFFVLSVSLVWLPVNADRPHRSAEGH
jgi:hypothetical protein